MLHRSLMLGSKYNDARNNPEMGKPLTSGIGLRNKILTVMWFIQ
jgi:hypothetical protein